MTDGKGAIPMQNWQEKYSFFQNPAPVQVDCGALVQRLQRPQGPVDVVLDTDTYNEIDDQYALAYLVLNDWKLRLKAIYAAPFCNSKAPGGPALCFSAHSRYFLCSSKERVESIPNGTS